jgi:hypothetical protein
MVAGNLAYSKYGLASLLLNFRRRLDSIETGCGRMRSLFIAQRMDNLSLESNNNGTQSFVHGGEVKAEIRYQVPTEIEDRDN